MDIQKIVGIGLVGAIMAVIFKKERPEISFMIGLMTCVIIFLNSITLLSELIITITGISEKYNIDIRYLSIVLKAIGIGFVSQFTSDICKDNGQEGVASMVLFGGKVIILFLSLPILLSVLELVSGLEI